MRYLGNKESILTEISDLLESQGLLKDRYIFFDAFCGSGSVSDYFKSYYDIIINDNLTWSVKYTKGRVCAPTCTFDKLGFDPFEYLNANENTVQGFLLEIMHQQRVQECTLPLKMLEELIILENKLKLGKTITFCLKKNIAI